MVRLARENSGWGYDRIVGALANLGYQVSDQTVGQHPAPAWHRPGAGEEQNHWKDFIRRHMHVLAGTDFFSVEMLTWRGLVTYYVLFFIHLESRRVSIAGITDHPEACWMRQAACNATFDGMGHLHGCRYLLHDRDTKLQPRRMNILTGGEALGTIELAADEVLVPSENGAGLGHASHLRQSFASESFPYLGQRTSLRIRQAQPGGQVRPQNAVLCCQVLVLQKQFLVHQSRDIRQETSPLIAVHANCPSSQVSHSRVVQVL
jgi:hypothetical protein